MSEENREVWKKAQATRTAIHGAPTEALIKGRGQTPWTEHEKNMLSELLQNENYKSESGTPDYAFIAKQLNSLFHEDRHIRTKKSLGNYVRDLRRKRKKTE